MLFFGIVVSNAKLNGIWVDYITLGLMQTYFLYFNSQLFTLDYQITKGKQSILLFSQYSQDTQGDSSDES